MLVTEDALKNNCKELSVSIKREISEMLRHFTTVGLYAKTCNIGEERLIQIIKSPNMVAEDLISILTLVKLFKSFRKIPSFHFSGNTRIKIEEKFIRPDKIEGPFQEWFVSQIQAYLNDPEFITEGIKLALGEHIIDLMKRNYTTKKKLAKGMYGNFHKYHINCILQGDDIYITPFNLVNLAASVGEKLIFRLEDL